MMRTEKSHYMSPSPRLCTDGPAWKGKLVSEPADHRHIHCQWLPTNGSNSPQQVSLCAYAFCAYVHACASAHPCAHPHVRARAHAHAYDCADPRAGVHAHAHDCADAFGCHVAQSVMEEEKRAKGWEHTAEMHMHDLPVQIGMHKGVEEQWALVPIGCLSSAAQPETQERPLASESWVHPCLCLLTQNRKPHHKRVAKKHPFFCLYTRIVISFSCSLVGHSPECGRYKFG